MAVRLGGLGPLEGIYDTPCGEQPMECELKMTIPTIMSEQPQKDFSEGIYDMANCLNNEHAEYKDMCISEREIKGQSSTNTKDFPVKNPNEYKIAPLNDIKEMSGMNMEGIKSSKIRKRVTFVEEKPKYTNRIDAADINDFITNDPEELEKQKPLIEDKIKTGEFNHGNSCDFVTNQQNTEEPSALTSEINSKWKNSDGIYDLVNRTQGEFDLPFTKVDINIPEIKTGPSTSEELHSSNEYNKNETEKKTASDNEKETGDYSVTDSEIDYSDSEFLKEEENQELVLISMHDIDRKHIYDGEMYPLMNPYSQYDNLYMLKNPINSVTSQSSIGLKHEKDSNSKECYGGKYLQIPDRCLPTFEPMPTKSLSLSPNSGDVENIEEQINNLNQIGDNIDKEESNGVSEDMCDHNDLIVEKVEPVSNNCHMTNIDNGEGSKTKDVIRNLTLEDCKNDSSSKCTREDIILRNSVEQESCSQNIMYNMPRNKEFTNSSQFRLSLPCAFDAISDFKVLTPKKVGGVYVYDQVNVTHQDYDVPPSRYFPGIKGIPGAPSMAGEQSLYDTPSSALSNRLAVGADPTDVYDVPPSHAHIPLGALSSPSNRSSTVSMRSNGSTMSSSSGPCGAQGSNPSSTCGSARSSTEFHDIYDVPPPAKAVHHTSPLALERKSSEHDPMSLYDTPPKQPFVKTLIEDFDHDRLQRDADSGIDTCKDEGTYDEIHENSFNCSQEHDIDGIYDRPTNNARAVPFGEGRVQGFQVARGTNDSSVYDIPPQVTRDSAISMRSDNSSLLDDISNRLSACSVASSSGSSEIPPVHYDELPLDIDAALELLVKLQQEVHSATSRLLSFVHSSWREQSELETKLYDIRLGCLGVQATLQEFVDFGQGALANSAKADDKKLMKKLSQLLEPLQESKKIVNTNMHHLNEKNWAIGELVSSGRMQGEADALGCIVSKAKEIPANVRTMASCIQGNSTLLFKKSQQLDEPCPSGTDSPKKGPPVRPKPKPTVLPKPKNGQAPKQEVLLERRTSVQNRPLPPPPEPQELASPGMDDHDSSGVYSVPHGDEDETDGDKTKYTNKGDFLEDYDYVHLENRPPQSNGTGETTADVEANKVPSQSESNNSGLSTKFKERLSQIQGNNNNEPSKEKENFLHPNDRQILMFYAGQIGAHTTQLVNAIDSFFQCIEYNQPPKVFIAHSKNVVLSAHKMVFICDTLHRNLMNEEVKVKIMACANYLCECLKLAVNATKNAALQFPNVVSVQEMVDRVVDVSHASNEIKLVITQAAIL